MATSTDKFRIKLRPNTSYNFSVDWGDGELNRSRFVATTPSDENNAYIEHAYSQPGIYNVQITENVYGGFPGLYFNGTSNTNVNTDDVKVLEIYKWGDLAWSKIDNSFEGCTNLSSVATDGGVSTLSGVTDFSYAWSDCVSLSSFPLIDTSRGINFTGAWKNCTSLKDFSGINVSQGTSFQETWSGCISLTSFPALTINTTATTINFIQTWLNCSSLKEFPTINTLKARSLSETWKNCSSLKEFPLINTSNVTTLNTTWSDCTSLTSFPLIDTSKVTNFQSAWASCVNLSASDFPQLNMSKMTEGLGCFENVELTTNSYSALLTSLCATNFNEFVVFNAGLSVPNAAGAQAKDFLQTVRNWAINDGTN